MTPQLCAATPSYTMTEPKEQTDCAYLIATPSGPGVKPFEVGQGETTVGRNPANTVHLTRGAVSRFHAKIRYVDGHYVIHDLESRNGTYINDKRVTQAQLSNGDLVTFGNRTFLFSLEGPLGPQRVSRVTFSSADKVRIFGEETGQRPAEVMARHADTASRRILEPPAAGDQATLQDAVRIHKRLSLLYQFTDELRMATSTDDMLESGMDLLFGALPAERGALLLKSSPGAPLEPRVVRHRADDSDGQIPVSRTVLNRVMNQRMAVLCRDAMDDSRFKESDSIRYHSLRSILCVPLLVGDHAIGALHLDSSKSLDAFDNQDLEFAAAVANEMAVSIEKHRLQQQAVNNERMAAIGLTITNIAHNIKNILLMNKGAEELMEMALRRVEDDKLKKSWGLVQSCLDRINRLSADMLNFARVEFEELAPVDINAVILANEGAFEKSLSREGVKLEFDLADSLPNWMMNEMGLQRALLNLVVNANDAIDKPDGGRIVIRTRLNEQDALDISVSDNGCGISKESLAQVFTLFYTTKSTRGTGLGLPMVKKFVESMGGAIDVESQPGVGSTFTMVFPVKSDETIVC